MVLLLILLLSFGMIFSTYSYNSGLKTGSYVRLQIVLTIIFQKNPHKLWCFFCFEKKSNLNSGQLLTVCILNPKREGLPALVTRGVEFQMLN